MTKDKFAEEAVDKHPDNRALAVGLYRDKVIAHGEIASSLTVGMLAIDLELERRKVAVLKEEANRFANLYSQQQLLWQKRIDSHKATIELRNEQIDRRDFTIGDLEDEAVVSATDFGEQVAKLKSNIEIRDKSLGLRDTIIDSLESEAVAADKTFGEQIATMQIQNDELKEVLDATRDSYHSFEKFRDIRNEYESSERKVYQLMRGQKTNYIR